MEPSIEQKNKALQQILSVNSDLQKRSVEEGWKVLYDKRTDMVTIGKEFPAGTFYYPVEDGFMLRVDKDNKIYGFAIENAKLFVEKHKEFLPLSFVIYPYRSLFMLASFILIHKTLNGMKEMGAIFSASQSYVASKACYA